MSRVDGGPAFPIPGAVSHYDDGSFSDDAHVGLSVRDYFAAKAMAALMALNVGKEETGMDGVDFVVRGAYAMADAMLSARGAP